jgi:polysaccharide export outer membrane protein
MKLPRASLGALGLTAVLSLCLGLTLAVAEPQATKGKPKANAPAVPKPRVRGLTEPGVPGRLPPGIAPPGPAVNKGEPGSFEFPENRPGNRKDLPSIDTIKPLPLPPIPDNPPPHEGAMLDVPFVIEPSDLLIVEVLEALPGRPITGERLVRPDGTVNLGFYGDVHVSGLTLVQAKEKIILHLRPYLNDETLGLWSFAQDREKVVAVKPRDSDRVLVDLTAYNGRGKSYFVQGDVTAPGRLPATGSETVLDAINYAGGLIPAADPRNIRLYRPARGGKPAKVYQVNFEAIQRGETSSNYQIFPGDRLVIGRDELASASIRADRLASEFRNLTDSMLQLGNMTRALNTATPDLTTSQRESLLREWFDLWWKTTNQPGVPVPDEATFRELLLKQFKRPAGANAPADPGKK